MKFAGGVFVGVLAGIAIAMVIAPANESSCCQRVAFGARDKIAGLAGPFEGLVAGALDVTGLTKVFPGLLDKLGVPADA